MHDYTVIDSVLDCNAHNMNSAIFFICVEERIFTNF